MGANGSVQNKFPQTIGCEDSFVTHQLLLSPNCWQPSMKLGAILSHPSTAISKREKYAKALGFLADIGLLDGCRGSSTQHIPSGSRQAGEARWAWTENKEEEGDGEVVLGASGSTIAGLRHGLQELLRISLPLRLRSGVGQNGIRLCTCLPEGEELVGHQVIPMSGRPGQFVPCQPICAHPAMHQPSHTHPFALTWECQVIHAESSTMTHPYPSIHADLAADLATVSHPILGYPVYCT